MIKSKYSNHASLFILALTTAIVACSLYAYIWYQIGVSTTITVDTTNQVRSQSVDNNQSIVLIKTTQNTEKNRNALASHFLSSTDAVGFIESLENIGTQTGSVIKISSIKIATSSSMIGSAHGHVDAHGSWSSVMKILLLAETLPNVSMIDNLRLSGAAGQKGNTDWQISFDLDMLTVNATSSTQ